MLPFLDVVGEFLVSIHACLTDLWAACFGFGYAVWLVDEFTCGLLTDMRSAIGLPLGFVLELHGW